MFIAASVLNTTPFICAFNESYIISFRIMNVFFGPSQDASGVNMVDCIRVFSKTKEAFGFPDDTEEYNGGSAAASSNNANNSSSAEGTGGW